MGDDRTYRSLIKESPWLFPKPIEKLPLSTVREQSSGSQSKSSVDDELAALKISSVLESKIFTVVVGAERRELAVHESVLSKSPVLQRFCRGGFLEATTGRIELKDDDPEIFDKVLSYLYRGDYEPFMLLMDLPHAVSAAPWEMTNLDDKYAMDSAMVYIMADKYQLDGLKEVAVTRIQWLQPLGYDVFFTLSSWIYAAVPESDNLFRDFFLEFAPGQLRSAPQTTLAPYIREGGVMAEDMVYALRSHAIHKERRTFATEMDDTLRRLYTTSAVARMVYWTLQEYGARHGIDERYLGSKAALVARGIDRSLEDVHTAAKELKDIGLLVVLGASDGSGEPGNELWDINLPSVATWSPGSPRSSLPHKNKTRH